MLVLTRKVGEKIQIGPSITLTVVALDGGKVRLGIEAPEEVRIFRSELNTFLGRLGAETPVDAGLVASSV